MADTKQAMGAVDAGDFDRLTECFYGKVLFYTIKRTGDSSAAQDIVHDTFLKAFLNIKKLRNPEAFQSWLFSICRNEIRNYYGRRMREIPHSAPEPSPVEPPGLPGETDSLMMALLELSRDMADAVIYHYFCDMTIRDMALLLSLKESTVKSRLYEARRKLREYLPRAERRPALLSSDMIRRRLLIMQTTQLYFDGAYVFSRLSLNGQRSFYEAVAAGEAFRGPLLMDIGAVTEGRDFIKQCGGRLTLPELAGVLLCCDRDTVDRLFDELGGAPSALDERMRELSGEQYRVEAVEVWLNVESVEDTIAWYEVVLGWHGAIDARDGDGKGTFGCIGNGSMESLARESVIRGYRTPPPGICLMRGPVARSHNQVIFIIVSDIDRIHDSARRADCRELGEIEAQPWGMRTFDMRDVNGYPLRIAQRM